MKKQANKKKCPVCGNLLPLSENFCGRCSFRLDSNGEKAKVRKFWKNLAFILVIILLFYVSIRHFRGLPILP